MTKAELIKELEKAENVRGYCLCENCIDQYSYAQKELGKPEKEKKKK